jgi:hypothetical protein
MSMDRTHSRDYWLWLVIGMVGVLFAVIGAVIMQAVVVFFGVVVAIVGAAKWWRST